MDSIISVLIMLAMIAFSYFSSSKEKKKKPKRKPLPRPVVQNPQVPPARGSGNVPKPKTLEDIFAEMMGEAAPKKKRQTPTPVPAPMPSASAPSRPIRSTPPPPKARPSSQKTQAHDRDVMGHKHFSYEQNMEDEEEVALRHIRARRNAPATRIADPGILEVHKSKKRDPMKAFKFNAKDAIIYDIIMNRKY